MINHLNYIFDALIRYGPNRQIKYKYRKHCKSENILYIGLKMQLRDIPSHLYIELLNYAYCNNIYLISMYRQASVASYKINKNKILFVFKNLRCESAKLL